MPERPPKRVSALSLVSSVDKKGRGDDSDLVHPPGLPRVPSNRDQISEL